MSDLHACAAKQVVSSPWGASLLGSPSPFAESHAKDAPRQIPSKFRTSPITQVANIEKMGRHKRYDAPQQQECKEAQVVSGGHVDGSKRSRPDLPETISM